MRSIRWRSAKLQIPVSSAIMFGYLLDGFAFASHFSKIANFENRIPIFKYYTIHNSLIRKTDLSRDSMFVLEFVHLDALVFFNKKM